MTRPRLARALFKVPIVLYRLRLGRLLGHRFLLLVHRGRRTGLERRTVLEVVRWDVATTEAVVLSGWGRRADWFRNVAANGAAKVHIGGRSFVAHARELSVDEAMEVFAAYERRNRLITPAVRFVVSRLVGWRYDGSDDARRRLVGERPLVAFRRSPP